jgi:hypothetical protein
MTFDINNEVIMSFDAIRADGKHKEIQQVNPTHVHGMLVLLSRHVTIIKNNYVEHWEVEIELARIEMQLNCVRDKYDNFFVYGQSGYN